MKTIVALSCLLSISIAAILPDSEWERYKAEYKKSYNGELDVLRYKMYMESKNEIVEHNRKYEAGLVSFTKGVNQFTDMLRSEVKEMHMGLGDKFIPPSLFCSPHNSSGQIPPSSIDWRKKQAVTQVDDQGFCGSCWAFSTAAALEGQFTKKYQKLVSMSKEQLVECDHDDHGCGGGLPWKAFMFIKKAGGIDSEESYPYTSGDAGIVGQCQSKGGKVVTSVRSCQFIKEGDEAALENAVGNVGPISVVIYASYDFQFYDSGILCGDGCHVKPAKLNHAVAVVGYGTDEFWGDYWLLKNSWGEDWGESGYIRVCRNKGNEACVASFGTYPVL